MRILFVSPYLPSRRSGAPVRLQGLMRALAARHSVSLLAAVPPEEEPPSAALEALREYCDEVVTARNDRAGLSGTAKRALQLRSLVSARSYERLVHARPSLQAALTELAERREYDVVQVESCFLTHFRFPQRTPIVLDEHNVEYEILRRTVSVAGTFRKLYSYLDQVKVRAEELHSWRTVDACALTSPRDEAAVRSAVPAARTAVVPNGVDLEFFSPRGTPRADRPAVLFFGALDYFPNSDAALFFLREVMPPLRRSHPGVELVIVGRSAPGAIERSAAADVIVTGAVDDVRPYLERARVVVAPLRVGGGTRLKILEAMAMGTAVVSTSLGAEGLAVTHEREVLIADGGEAFAAQVARVLDDDDLAARLGAAGRRLVEARYGWDASARELEGLYRRALLARGRSPDGADAAPPARSALAV